MHIEPDLVSAYAVGEFVYVGGVVLGEQPLGCAGGIFWLDLVAAHGLPPQRCWAAWRVMPSREPISAQE